LLLRSRWTSPLRHAASASLLATTLRRALSAIVLQDQSSDMVQNDGAVQCRVLMQNGGRSAHPADVHQQQQQLTCSQVPAGPLHAAATVSGYTKRYD
jgi:hypothetical protein